MFNSIGRFLCGGVVLLLALIAPVSMLGQDSAAVPVAPVRALAKITLERGRTHVMKLASDKMMGRNTPSPELDSAADYIAGQFKKYGVQPVNGTYFHNYTLKRLSLGDRNRLVIAGKSMNLKDDYLPYDFSVSDSVAGNIVFAGFGLKLPSRNYDDYEGLDVRGKIVLVITGVPRAFLPTPKGDERRGPRRMIMGNPEFQSALPVEKARLAASHGAIGIIFVADPVQYKDLRIFGPSWNTPIVQLDLPNTNPSIPAVVIGSKAAQALFNGNMEQFIAYVRPIDSLGKPNSVLLDSGIRASINTHIEKTILPVRNVVGVVTGKSKPGEYIVVGAHYDHVGHGKHDRDTSGTPGDTIYNGADDNASGTAGMLMNAEAFAALKGKDRPDRSILFIAFSGEEKGLLGSRAYVETPLIPNEQSVAMFNMDMIGRNGRDSVAVIGVTRSPDLFGIAKRANIEGPMIFVGGEEYFFRSDQASFARKRIPVLFFSTGEHADYHKVSDSPDKIDYEKLARIARLCFRSVWITSQTPQRPGYIEQ